MLPDHVELPTPGLRMTWLGTGCATVIFVMVAAVVWVLMAHEHHATPPPEQGYLSALDDAGLMDAFNSDVNAVAHGKQVCRHLEDGAAQQGPPADKLAVDAFCPDFSQGFKVLESATVSGTFVLMDSATANAIASDGASCQGAGGYADVGRNTAVTVRNGKGEILTSTTLGEGKGTTSSCTFAFSFPVTEGEDRYVVSVGRRGEFIYTFEQIRAVGVRIRLGQ